jgi:hypothetical protein
MATGLATAFFSTGFVVGAFLAAKAEALLMVAAADTRRARESFMVRIDLIITVRQSENEYQQNDSCIEKILFSHININHQELPELASRNHQSQAQTL